MAAATVRVRGLRELQRDFRKMEGDLDKKLKAELKEAAQVVATEATSRFSDISPRSAAGFRPVVRARGVAVEQRYRRTSGAHPSFGRLQMGVALIPALEDKQGDVIDGLEKMLDRLADQNGF